MHREVQISLAHNDNKAHNLASFPVEEMKAHCISESMVGKMAESGSD